MESVLALVQRPVDTAGVSHSIRRNLPKTAPDLAAPPVFPEETGETTTKTARAAPQERA